MLGGVCAWSHRAVTSRVAAVACACVAAGCEARRAERAQCAYSDECEAGLVCAGGACRAACRTDRDCTAGAQCRPSGTAAGRACQPPDAPPLCLYASDCAPSQVCGHDGVCRAECRADRDCAVRAPWLAGARCDPNLHACTAAAARVRLIAPLSGSRAAGSLGLRWEVPPGTVDVVIEACAERTCTNAPRAFPIASPSQTFYTLILPPGVWFWRVRASTGASAIWKAVFTGRAAGGSLRPLPPLDVNDDGLADLAVGAPEESTRQGRVYVYAGQSAPPTAPLSGTAIAIVDSPAAMGGRFGAGLAAVGDIDEDGNTDLLVTGAGIVPLLYVPGTRGGLAASASPLAGTTSGPIARAGDVDGDGREDALVGLPAVGHFGVITSANMTASPRLSIEIAGSPGAPFAGFGGSVAGAGDIDNDGIDDALIGAPVADPALAGAMAVYHGARGALNLSRVLFDPAQPANAHFAQDVAGAGDVNGDGFADIAVTEQLPAPGRVLVYHGSATGLPATPSTTIALASRGGTPSVAHLAALGDANGDGYADLAVSVTDADEAHGYVAVFAGSATGLDASAPVLIEQPDDATLRPSFGAALSGPGDLNGDALGDLVIGVPGRVAVEVHLGGPSGIGAMPAQRVSGVLMSGVGSVLPR